MNVSEKVMRDDTHTPYRPQERSQETISLTYIHELSHTHTRTFTHTYTHTHTTPTKIHKEKPTGWLNDVGMCPTPPCDFPLSGPEREEGGVERTLSSLERRSCSKRLPEESKRVLCSAAPVPGEDEKSPCAAWSTLPGLANGDPDMSGGVESGPNSVDLC
jgi:hypothetical protein